MRQCTRKCNSRCVGGNVPWLRLRAGPPRVGKRAATSLRAIVAGWRRDLFRHLWTTAARRLRQSSEYLWPIVAANFHKSSRYLCATAATGWRQSAEYLLPIAADYLRKSSQYLWASAARGRRQSAEYVGTAVAGHPGKSSKIRMALAAALAIASGLVGFVTTSALLRAPAPAPVRLRHAPAAKTLLGDGL